jgi:hypothetical protein
MDDLIQIESQVRRSPCPYARAAQLRFARPVSWPFGLSELHATRDELAAFSRDDATDLADTLVLPVLRAARLDLHEWAVLLKDLLSAIHDGTTDPVDSHDDPAWDFEYGGVRYFVMVLAPLYPENHPRTSGLANTGLILFHPERAFRKFGISSSLEDRLGLSRRIQKIFEQSGRPYDLRLVTDVPKSQRYLKPLEGGGPPVDWCHATSHAQLS